VPPHLQSVATQIEGEQKKHYWCYQCNAITLKAVKNKQNTDCDVTVTSQSIAVNK